MAIALVDLLQQGNNITQRRSGLDSASTHGRRLMLSILPSDIRGERRAEHAAIAVGRWERLSLRRQPGGNGKARARGPAKELQGQGCSGAACRSGEIKRKASVSRH
jgi:hypothetical protein